MPKYKPWKKGGTCSCNIIRLFPGDNAIPQELRIIQTMKLGEKEKNSFTDFESIIQQHFDFPIRLESPLRK